MVCSNRLSISYSFWDIQRAVEIGVGIIQGRWKIIYVDRSYTTSYQSAIVSTALSCTIFDIFDGEKTLGYFVYLRI